MTISAKIICDSISPEGIRLTTFQLRYPRFIHSEFMTHRMFSRNASSSRAIPVARLIQDVMDDPAMPVFWGRNRPGMQATEELEGEERQAAIDNWLVARDDAVKNANHLNAMGVHKQLVNRVIEPWCHINVVVTATEWNNFFALRRHPAAQPEIHALADAMWDVRQQARIPALLNHGGWHLPYVSDEDYATYNVDPVDPLDGDPEGMDLSFVIKHSVARVARVSYSNHDGTSPDLARDLKLHGSLLASGHMSPFEHQATPDYRRGDNGQWMYPEEHGNLVGWRQHRKMLRNESVPG